ncbi:hypothetical protein EVAR_11033_1 [Eumeta japonica]|uniref:Uncharacterized protein n=1 Tax=Eumeta variegata TaxID=151549 RepID=A0A4C1U3V5_EUMVA|nr:hypothetical protein EVAR_11033_1 [Eumeta japonica]
MRKLSKENDQDYWKHLPTGKHRKLHGSTEYPDVGKTWIVQEFDNKRDCIVTATIEAAEDPKRKLANRIEPKQRPECARNAQFRERAQTEAGTGVVVARHGFPAPLTTKQTEKYFWNFASGSREGAMK